MSQRQYDDDLSSAWSFGAKTPAERLRFADGCGHARSEILAKLTKFYTFATPPDQSREPMTFIGDLISEIRKQLDPGAEQRCKVCGQPWDGLNHSARASELPNGHRFTP